jgi:putative aldouronate transport system permease protein
MSMPDSLSESARIDGANDLLIFCRIILPLSLPIVATIALWCAVEHWNSWFDAMVYTNGNNYIVLQLYLKRMIDALTYNQALSTMSSLGRSVLISKENLVSSAIVITIGPIVMAYPFAQKYLIKGIMMGSFKG